MNDFNGNNRTMLKSDRPPGKLNKKRDIMNECMQLFVSASICKQNCNSIVEACSNEQIKT